MPPDDAPQRKIADAIHGEVQRFLGRVVSCEGELLTAPLTGRRCVAFDAAVKAFVWPTGVPRDSLDDDHLYGIVREAELLVRSLRARPFTIEDASGRAHVDPRGAFVRLTLDHREGGPNRDQQVSSPRVADPEFVAGMAKHSRLEYLEGVLAIGEEVVVTGLVHLPAAGDASLYRANADRRILIAGSADVPADVTDRRDDVEMAGGSRLPPIPESPTRQSRGRQHVSGRIIAPDD